MTLSFIGPELYGPELGVLDTRQLELPGREALAHLGDRCAQDAALLRRARRPEALSRRLFFGAQPRLAALLAQEPRAPVAREDDVREHVVHAIAHGGHGARASGRHALVQAR